jgi:hypothetical protein
MRHPCSILILFSTACLVTSSNHFKFEENVNCMPWLGRWHYCFMFEEWWVQTSKQRLAVCCAPQFLISDSGIMPKVMPSLFHYTSLPVLYLQVLSLAYYKLKYVKTNQE